MNDHKANRSITLETFLRLKTNFRPRNRKSGTETINHNESQPFDTGRDPRKLGNVFAELMVDEGWSTPTAQVEVVMNWTQIVGEVNSAKTRALNVDRGVLNVLCINGTWATQMRVLQQEILRKITADYPQAQITSIRFQVRDSPTFKRGPRSIPGRGPRDTYD